MATIGAPSATASSVGPRAGTSHVGGALPSRAATYSSRHRRSAATAAAARQQQQRWSLAVGGDVTQGVRLPAAETGRTRGGRGARVARASAEAAAEADPAAGVALYNPKSYDALVKDAARSVQYALADNHTRLEVDFPPLPSSVSGYEGASEDYIDANIQLALAMVRRLRESNADLSVKLVFPDTVEKRVGARKFRSALELVEGVKLGSLDEAGGSPNFFAQLKSAFDLDFDFEAKETAEKWSSTAPADLYIILNASTAELPAVERYTESLSETAAVLLFNLELETLRADLGLFGFPPKDVHYRFLSRFLPVFFLRMRDYSKSVAVAPFILNYSGALLRLYPGPWQVMLKQGNGSFACVAEGPTRFTLGETKEELLRSLGLQEEEGSTMEFLRRGYKTKTWWEEEIEAEASANWRT